MWRLGWSGIKPMEKISRTIIGPESGSVHLSKSPQARMILKPGTESFQSHPLSDRGGKRSVQRGLHPLRISFDFRLGGRRQEGLGDRIGGSEWELAPDHRIVSPA